MKSWCKVMDALGDVFMTKYLADCLEYIKLWNKDSQLRLNDQNFLDLFMGGICKLHKLNEDYQQSSKTLARRASVECSGRVVPLCRRLCWSASTSVLSS